MTLHKYSLKILSSQVTIIQEYLLINYSDVQSKQYIEYLFIIFLIFLIIFLIISITYSLILEYQIKIPLGNKKKIIINTNEILNILLRNKKKLRDYPIFMEVFPTMVGYTILISGAPVFAYIERRIRIDFMKWLTTQAPSAILKIYKKNFDHRLIPIVNDMVKKFGCYYWIRAVNLPKHKFFHVIFYTKFIVTRLEIPELGIDEWFIDSEGAVIVESFPINFSSFTLTGSVFGRIHYIDGTISPIHFNFIPLNEYSKKIRYFNI